MDDQDIKLAKRRVVTAKDEAVIFSMRNQPLLEQGTIYDPLATSENMWAAIKVYASGGENALHSHGGEDHVFVLMQGKATFTFGDGSTRVVHPFEGVMIPKNVKYNFEADEAENLVMLRVGAGVRPRGGLDDITAVGTPRDISELTTFADGAIKVGNAPKNGESSKMQVIARGKYFAPD